MLYSVLADAYERIEGTTKRLEMTDHLVELFGQTPSNIVDKVAYLTLGQLYPPFVGIELGIAEKLAIRAIAVAAARSDAEVAALYKQLGDLGAVAERVLAQGRVALAREPLTVEHVYRTFEEIAHATGPGSVELKVTKLANLLANAGPKEARYILRTVTGRLRIGVADMTILDGLAEVYAGGRKFRGPIERAYNLSSDLGHVARVLAEQGMKGIEQFRVTPGKPIRCMLAERLTNAEEILEKLGGRGAVEYKYDGLRLQAHISPNEIALFSRRIENLTGQFPDVVQALREAVRVDVAVVEGEAVAVDPNTGELQPFQTISQRRGRKYQIEAMVEEVPVVTFLFDALCVNGEDLTTRPYLERRRALEGAIRPTERVRLAEMSIVETPGEVDRLMDLAVSSGCEGVMVKDVGPNSVYTAGARQFRWIKYKREYKSELADTVDLVAVGAFAGRGKRAGSYGALLMAAYDADTDTFKTLCKLGTGFTDEDLANLPGLFEPYKIGHRHARVDSRMEADFWFTPAVVLEVIGAELTLSPLHTCALGAIREGAGLAIRFPRFTGRWRRDKAPEDATTVKELVDLYRGQLKKVAG